MKGGRLGDLQVLGQVVLLDWEEGRKRRGKEDKNMIEMDDAPDMIEMDDAPDGWSAY